MLIAAPFYIGVSLVAGPLVATFFGPKWLEMIPIVAGLTAVMPAMALQIACSPATNALGRARVYMLTSTTGALVMPVCFLFGVTHGPGGLVASWHVAAPLLLAVTLALTLPAIRVTLSDLIDALLPVAAGCAAMAIVVSLVKPLVTGLAPEAQLLALAVTGAATYGATLWLAWPAVLRDSWAMLRKPRASAPKPADPTAAAAG
jgi:O-antigen/teichoic acid export membrane protein